MQEETGGGADELVLATLTWGEAARGAGFMLETASGSMLPVELDSMPVLDERETVSGAVVTFRDVAERLEAEREKRRSEEEHRSIVESVSEAISITVGDRRVFVNDAFVRMYGLHDHAEALGIPLAAMVVEEDRHKVLAATDAQLAGEQGAGRLTFRVRRHDGAVRVIEANAVITSYRGERARLAVLRDVTEQRDAAEALRASDDRFRGIFEGAAEGIATLDLDGRFMEANPSFLERLGYRMDELRGKAMLEITHPDDVEAHEERWRMLRNGAGHLKGEQRFLRKNVTVLWGEVTKTLLRGTDGEPEFGFVLVEDVTERKVDDAPDLDQPGLDQAGWDLPDQLSA